MWQNMTASLQKDLGSGEWEHDLQVSASESSDGLSTTVQMGWAGSDPQVTMSETFTRGAQSTSYDMTATLQPNLRWSEEPVQVPKLPVNAFEARSIGTGLGAVVVQYALSKLADGGGYEGGVHPDSP